MWQFYVALGVVSVWWLLLRPRTGGKAAPPMVLSSTVVQLPLVGVLVEFLKSPNDMMRRCYQDYGSVYTIPVHCRRFFADNESSHARGIVFAGKP